MVSRKGRHVRSPLGAQSTDCGIIPVAGDLAAWGGWEVAHLTHHPPMCCDIALRRRA